MTPQPLTLPQRASLDEALERGGLWESHAGGCIQPAPPLFLGQGLEKRIVAPHQQSAHVDGLGLMCLLDALVYDQAFAGNANGPFYSDRLYPGYINQFILTAAKPSADFSLAGKTEIALPGVSILLHNCHAAVYGHWLLEGLVKLLYLRSVRPNMGEFRFIAQTKYTPAHVLAWINLLFPGVEVARYDATSEFVRCERLVLPTLGFSAEYVFHTAVSGFLNEVATPRMTHRFIYPDRDKPSTYHWIENTDEIRAVAESFGFEVLYPETLALSDQICAFAGAKVVAADFGSALHNTIFSPRETVVLSFNWVTVCQSRVAQLRKQRLGYQMGVTGAPAIRQGYTLDPEMARRAFEVALRVSQDDYSNGG